MMSDPLHDTPVIEPSPRLAAGRVHRKDKKIDFQFAR